METAERTIVAPFKTSSNRSWLLRDHKQTSLPFRDARELRAVPQTPAPMMAILVIGLKVEG
jgi:hypothetical protein